MGKNQRAIYKADTWHVDDGTGPTVVRRPQATRAPGLHGRVQAGHPGRVRRVLRVGREGGHPAPGGALLEPDHRLAAPAPPGPVEGGPRAGRRGPRRAVALRGGQAPDRERAAAGQAGPGRGGDRRPGKSARALGRDLQERGLRASSGRHPRCRRSTSWPRWWGARRACAALGRSRATHYRATPATPVRPAGAEAIAPARWRDHEADAVVDDPQLGAVLRQGSGPGVGHPARRGDLPGLDLHHVPPAAGTGPGAESAGPRPAARPSVKPELVATAPNQVWSWDITKLAGPYKWTWFQLYTILDVYSRYVVGWLVAPKESATLAEQLIADAIYRHGVPAGQLTLHADRGSSMTSQDGQPAPGRPGRPPEPLPAARVQRQPLLRSPSSRPSSTRRPSPSASPTSPQPGRSATGSSSTTTTNTATRASASTPRPTSTSGWPRWSGRSARASSTPPMRPCRNGSGRPPQAPQDPRGHSGSTDPRRRPSPSEVSEQSVSHIC